METILFFDLETTSTSITKDRIIQISLILCSSDGFKILEKKKFYFNNCGVPIHQKAIEAHGITEEFLKDKPPFSAYAKRIFDYIQAASFIAGYNIKTFDVPLLIEEFGRCNLDWTPDNKKIIDSCIIFKKRESRTLSAATKFYCGKELEGAHDAENDVLATIDVLQGQIFMYGLDDIDVLVSESQYEESSGNKKFDYAGRIIAREEDGVPIWSFGKNVNQPVLNDLNYCDWFLSADFSYNSKQVLRKLLNERKNAKQST